jgi:hypothetical protein
VLNPGNQQIRDSYRKSDMKSMNQHRPALLSFAQREEGDWYKDSIYKYIADAGFEPEEVKNWGRIGALMDVLKEDDHKTCEGCLLDESLVEFVSKLPPGNTPRPVIRHQLQRAPVV